MIKNFLSKHILTVILTPAIVLTVAACFFRFFVLEDYLIAYEGDCDPETQSCYVWCEDSEDSSSCFYYSVIERHASEIAEKCDLDVSECDAAYVCQEDVEICSLSYCDPYIDGAESCDTINNENP
jgi:hypothetical protein